MELKIRGIDAKIVKQLDNQIAAINKNASPKLSRNDYLKILIEREGNKKLEKFKKDSWEVMLTQQNKLLSENLRALNRIFWLMTQGDVDQSADLLERMSSIEDELTEYDDQQKSSQEI